MSDDRLCAMRPSNHLGRFVVPPHLWRLRPFYWLTIDALDWLFPFCAVNLLWVLCSLTVVLFPPATAALFETAVQAYRGRSPSAGAFLIGVRRWLGPAWLWAFPNGLMVASAIVVGQDPGVNEMVATITAAVVALALLGQIYVWPYMMLQDRPRVSQALRNSLFTVLADPLLTGMNLGLTVVIGIPGIVIIAPVLFILPVFFALLYTYTLVAWLGRHRLLPEPVREN